MADHRSPEAQAYRHLYKTAAWQRHRWAILVRDGFTCQKCGKLEAQTSQLVADHRQPHRGNLDLFWSEANIWTLCKPCHDSGKQSEERTGYSKAIGLDGWPEDARHPANRPGGG
jgi:5-methylcytosine-specific restriction enzyme A